MKMYEEEKNSKLALLEAARQRYLEEQAELLKRYQELIAKIAASKREEEKSSGIELSESKEKKKTNLFGEVPPEQEQPGQKEELSTPSQLRQSKAYKMIAEMYQQGLDSESRELFIKTFNEEDIDSFIKDLNERLDKKEISLGKAEEACQEYADKIRKFIKTMRKKQSKKRRKRAESRKSGSELDRR